jgi:preprotein translocase subunit SecF
MFNLVKHRYKFLIITAFVMVVAISALIAGGLKLAIDFSGGGVIEIQSAKCATDDCPSQLRDAFKSKEVEVNSVVSSGDNSFLVKTETVEQATWNGIKTELTGKYDDFKELSFESVGPILGQELLQKTIAAVLLASVLLLFYIGWRFKNRAYGVTAVLAMFHDVLVILGAFAIFGRFWSAEVDIMFVTAALTALSFSVHDTVVLYDRIREMLRRNPNLDFEEVVNLAFNSTLARSLSTSMSIIFVLLALVLLGGKAIFWFAVALLIGTISGVYSSPFVATPLLVIWHQWSQKRKRKKVV